MSQQCYLWFCQSHKNEFGYCNVNATVNAQDLTVDRNLIDYCLAQEIDKKCILQFSFLVMLIVIVCNLITTVCMILIVFEEGSQSLLIVSDAIASFLNKADSATKNICLTDKYFFAKND